MSHRYFIPAPAAGPGAQVLLTGAEAAHLARVLRARPGQLVTLCDGAGLDYEARVEAADPDTVRLTVVSSAPSVSEPALPVTLYVGLPKGDKLEWIIQKATELGAVRIVPFTSSFCVAKPKNEAAKLARYGRVALEAAKQSGRGRVPQVLAPIPFDELCRQAAGYSLALFCYEGGGARLVAGSGLHSRLAAAESVAVITGAEGGFSPAEAAQAQRAGCQLVGLGPRILRCETAPLAALCAIMALTGDL